MCPSDRSGQFGTTPNAFIFSLRNSEDLAPFKTMVTEVSLAIYKKAEYGPTFGNGYDIYIDLDGASEEKKSFTTFGQSYVPVGVKDLLTVLTGVEYFSPSEVEVFYLVRR